MQQILNHWLVLPLLSALRFLAADTACRLGGGLGVLAWRLGIRRRVASAQLESLLGLRGPARARVLKRAYASMGANFVEVMTIGGVYGPERTLTMLNPRWHALLHRRHGGVVYITPHLGAWDVGAGGLVKGAGKLVIYAKAQHNLEVDLYVNTQRQQLGYLVLLAANGDRTAAVTVLRTLRERGSVGLMADQRPGRNEGESAWFLGRAAHCHQGPAFFAQKMRAMIVPGCCLRVRAGHNVSFVGRPWAAPAGASASVTQAVMDQLSAMIAAHPGQYFWHHRRFAGTPPELLPRTSEPWRTHGVRLLVDSAPCAAS